jgi:threonylcarbamoyladenosine tRNA methylthiotransferase MtaB
MFQNTLAAMAEMEIVYPHVFPFSPRPDTPAARMPQVAPSVRRERAARLRVAAASARRRFLAKHVGHEIEILVETEKVGRSPHFAMVRFEPPAPTGSLQRVQITDADEETLYGVRPT